MTTDELPNHPLYRCNELWKTLIYLQYYKFPHIVSDKYC